jgi:hypothetical protein
MSYQKFIEGELGSLNDDRSKIDYDAGDYARYFTSLLNPFSDSRKYSKEGMLEEAQTAAETAINKGSSDDRTYIEQGLGGTKVNLTDLKIGKNETQEEYRKKIAALRAKATAATRYAGTEDADLGKITDDTSTQQINQLTTQQNKTNRVNQRQDNKDDQYELLKWQALREDGQNARQDKRLAQDRRLTAETNQMQLQLEYARLAQSDRNRRQDRKDRAIMSIVSGLGNLGAAFAI